SGNPGSGNALILASNTNAAPTGYLIDLQSGSSPTSKFKVDASGNVTAAGNYNTNTFNSNTLTFGSASTASIDVSSGQNLNIGTTNANNITIGRASSTNTTTINAGSGGISLGASTTISGSSTFTTGTGAVSLQGDTTLSAGKSLTFAAGAGNFDQHNSTGTFQTGSGNVSLNGATTVTGSNTFSVNSGNTSLGGNLDVTGSSAVKAGTDYATTGASNDVNFGDVSLVRLTGSSTQTITGIAGGRDGYMLTIINAASQAAVLANQNIGSAAANRITTGSGQDFSLASGASVNLIYDSSAHLWRIASSGNSVNTVGTLDAQTASANGAVILGNSIYLQSASANAVGLVNKTDQTFAGAKTFSSLATLQAGATISGGAIQLNVNSNNNTSINTGTSTGTVSIGGSSTGAISLESASNISLTTNSVTAGVIVQSLSNNSGAFQVQDSSTNTIFAVDTSGEQIILGKASSKVGKLVFNTNAGANNITLVGPAGNPTGNYTLTIPTITANANLCTDNSVCSGYASGTAVAGKLNKNNTDTSSANVSVSNNLYAFTNSSSGVASGVLYLDNTTNTASTLTVTASGNPGSGNALILASNTNAAPTGYLIDLQSGSSPTSKFKVDASGNVTA
ncbi:MAG TPA: hypothetical protein VFP35_01430, partial [Candidatus Saccharimonadales bacterium]|nr:hypothetical protein [Candidatus Saccharimonadales bacterium]